MIKHYNIICQYLIFSAYDLLFDVNYCLIRKLAICLTYSKWCQRSLWHQLALASYEFHS